MPISFFLVATFFLFGLGGCAKKNQSINEPIAVELKGTGDCVANMGRQLTAYVDGQLNVKEVSDFWSCMGEAINEYETVTSGDGYSGTYTAEALRHFIEHYFVQNHHVSDSLLFGMMNLKRVFLSGSTTALTRGELANLRGLLAELKTLSLQLQPFVPVLFHRQARATDDEVRAASVAMRAALAELGKWLDQQQQRYSFAELSDLLNAINAWMLSGGTVSQTFVGLQNAILVLPSAKSIFIGGDGKVIAPHDWPPLLDTLGRGFSIYLATSYGFSENIDAGLNRRTLPGSVAEGLALLDQSVRNHPGGRIANSDWQDLFKAFEQTQWLPSNITADRMNQLWLWLLRRPLGDGVTNSGGLGGAELSVLQRLFENWNILLNRPSQDPALIVQEFNRVIADSPPMQWDADGHLIFSANVPTVWRDSDRNRLIWPYVIMRFLKEAYVGTATDSLSEAQMNTAVAEVLPLLQSFGWLTTTSPTIGKRLLREADLFTDASNGNGQLEVTEATRFLAYVMSAYRSAQVWLGEADSLCPSYPVACVRTIPFLPGNTVFAALPRLQANILGPGRDSFYRYLDHAEQTVLKTNVSGNYTAGDLLQVFQILQYVESFVRRYDRDFSETIDLPEATLAFQTFGPTLTKLLAPAGVPSDQVLVFFTFMMKYGDTPFTMFGGQVAYLNWKWHSDSWQFDATRNDLMSILNQLSKL